MNIINKIKTTESLQNDFKKLNNLSPLISSPLFKKSTTLALACKISKECCLHSPLAYWCYKLLPISAAQITRMIANIITNKQPTQYACNMTEAGPHISHCFPPACMDDTIDIKFEDRTYRTMVGYKKYLSCTYGDYMTLPPEEERQTHKFKAYWKDS